MPEKKPLQLRRTALPSRWSTIIEQNWPAKIISVAAAVILFLFYRGDKPGRNVFFRFRFRSILMKVMRYLLPYRRALRSALRGSEENIYLILEDDIEVYADFTVHSSEGQFRAPVQFIKTGSARNIKELEIRLDPAEITLELERKIGPVPSRFHPLLTGYPEKGYELESVYPEYRKKP